MLWSAQDYRDPCAEFNNKIFSTNRLYYKVKTDQQEVLADDCLAASTSKRVTSIKTMS